MPDTLKFGIGRHVDEFIDEVKTKKTATIAERKNRVGETVRVYPHDIKTEITISGGGTCALALGMSTALGVTGITGGVIIVKEIEDTDKNTEFNEYQANATHYPNGTLGVAATATSSP